VPGINDNDGGKWGFTYGNTVLAWRTGVGVDKNGGLIYVASDALSVSSLAALLVRAGAVRAMEMDINHDWATFNLFTHPDPSNPAQISAAKLLPDMKKPATRYLANDDRDFVVVYAKTP
jgi:hypothetical protein